jgi:hypothetical protein
LRPRATHLIVVGRETGLLAPLRPRRRRSSSASTAARRHRGREQLQLVGSRFDPVFALRVMNHQEASDAARFGRR